MERKADLLKELGKASKQDHNHQETILAMIQRLLFFATSLIAVVAYEIPPYNQLTSPKEYDRAFLSKFSRYGL